MEIKSKKELAFYLMADRMMNRGRFKKTCSDRIMNLFFPDNIMTYLVSLRKASYYKNQKGYSGILKYAWYLRKNMLLGRRLGFSIGVHSLGYGVVIPHHGTIVIGAEPRIGNYAVLHTSTCISDNKKVIGDGLYLASGAKITSEIVLGNNVSIGANSVVNTSFIEDSILIAGVPARIIKKEDPWYVRDGIVFSLRRDEIESLKTKMNIS